MVDDRAGGENGEVLSVKPALDVKANGLRPEQENLLPRNDALTGDVGSCNLMCSIKQASVKKGRCPL
jgi:hypothetical protein